MGPSPEPFVIGSESVAPGRTKRIELPVSRLPTGAEMCIPVMVLNGKKPGPSMWLSAAVHGDEINGVEIIRRVLEHVQVARLTGALIAVPIVNVFGFITGDRYLPDRRDLNRSFPGSRTGSLAARIAYLFVEEIVMRCAIGVDLHTGSGGRANLPQVRADLDDPETLALTHAFGAPCAVHSPVRDGSMRAAATLRGRRVLVYEGGEANRFDEEAIARGTLGILRVMARQGMISEEGFDPPGSVFRSASSRWIRAHRSGLLHPSVRLGDRVAAGTAVAEIRDTFGKRLATLKARDEGLVIGMATIPLVHRGDAAIHVARPDHDRPV
jgi:hypothetical protein